MAIPHLNYMKIIKFFKINKFLLLILFLASVLRLWNLNNIPPHLTPDEASLGYNAYSILKTGRDEHGKLLPLVFRSFGDYKPGLYVYADVSFVALLGLNEWSTRLPSAIAGIVSVYLIFLIVGKLFNRQKHLPLIAAFVAATNPWLIYFSRGAWEANLSLALTLGGVYAFLISFENKNRLILSAFLFALTLITYQGAKLSTLIVVLLLLSLNYKKILKINFKTIVISTAVGLIISIPVVVSLFIGQAGRLTVFSIFSNSRPDSYLQKMLDQNNEVKGDLSYFLFHSDSYDTLRGIMGRMFNHFGGRFLFFEGDWPNLRHSAPYQGQLLLSDLLLIAFGFIYIVSNIKNEKRSILFILLWLIFSTLPSILTRDQVHAVRALNQSIPIIIIISLGLNYLLLSLANFKFIFAILFTGSFIYFLDSYFIHIPAHNSKLWDYGYKQIVENVMPIKENYTKITVQQSFAQPYIYFLYYTKYNPSLWQQNGKYIDSEFKGDVGYVTAFENVVFGPIDWSINRGDKGTLIVGDPVRIPQVDSADQNQFKMIKEIYYLNKRDIAFRIIEIK